MFFTECARLAERRPGLAQAVESIDAQLSKMGTAEVIRADDWASFLGIDPNQVSAVLEKLAQDGLLCAQEMVECSHCRMAVLRSEYLQLLEEDGEYRCTSCDQPLTGAMVTSIITYRRGQKWKDTSPKRDSVGGGPVDASGSEQADGARVGSFTPTPEHLAILRAHRDSPTTLTQVALEATTRISRKTIGARLKELQRHQLLHCPHGKKGTALTDIGRALLRQIDLRQPAASPGRL